MICGQLSCRNCVAQAPCSGLQELLYPRIVGQDLSWRTAACVLILGLAVLALATVPLQKPGLAPKRLMFPPLFLSCYAALVRENLSSVGQIDEHQKIQRFVFCEAKELRFLRLNMSLQREKLILLRTGASTNLRSVCQRDSIWKLRRLAS